MTTTENPARVVLAWQMKMARLGVTHSVSLRHAAVPGNVLGDRDVRVSLARWQSSMVAATLYQYPHKRQDGRTLQALIPEPHQTGPNRSVVAAIGGRKGLPAQRCKSL